VTADFRFFSLSLESLGSPLMMMVTSIVVVVSTRWRQVTTTDNNLLIVIYFYLPVSKHLIQSFNNNSNIKAKPNC